MGHVGWFGAATHAYRYQFILTDSDYFEKRLSIAGTDDRWRGTLSIELPSLTSFKPFLRLNYNFINFPLPIISQPIHLVFSLLLSCFPDNLFHFHPEAVACKWPFNLGSCKHSSPTTAPTSSAVRPFLFRFPFSPPSSARFTWIWINTPVESRLPPALA